MAKTYKWIVEADGINHSIEYTKSLTPKLMVDNTITKIEKSKNFLFFDQPINLGSKTVHFVMINGLVDVAVDGVYLNSNTEYIPPKEYPKWVWFFFIVCLIPLINLFTGNILGFRVVGGAIGGAINGMICFPCANLTLRISMSNKLSNFKKITINILISFLCWFADVSLLFLVTYLLFY